LRFKQYLIKKIKPFHISLTAESLLIAKEMLKVNVFFMTNFDDDIFFFEKAMKNWLPTSKN